MSDNKASKLTTNLLFCFEIFNKKTLLLVKIINFMPIAHTLIFYLLRGIKL